MDDLKALFDNGLKDEEVLEDREGLILNELLREDVRDLGSDRTLRRDNATKLIQLFFLCELPTQNCKGMEETGAHGKGRRTWFGSLVWCFEHWGRPKLEENGPN